LIAFVSVRLEPVPPTEKSPLGTTGVAPLRQLKSAVTDCA